MLTRDELAAEVEAGTIDTVVCAFTDMQGRLMGKREQAEFFLEETVGHGLEGCNYLLALDMEMDPQPGYAMASWERGYGDFHLLPDLATLRRVPWLEGTALVLCDVAWEDGSPVVASPRQVLAAQVERARAAGFEPMIGSELEFYLLKETYAEAHAKHYRDLTPSVPYILDYHVLATTYDEGLIRQIRNGMQAAGIPVESSKGEAWPGQQEINFRYADALRMADNHVIYKNGAKEIAHENGCSITFMAKPDHTWIGNSCHVHASLWRDGANAFAGDSEVFRAFLAGWIACAKELALFLAPNINSYKRYAAGELGADDARLGPRQPHLRLPDRRARPLAARRDADPGRRRQPVPRVRGADRRGAARDRAGARAAAGARGQRLRVGRGAVPVVAARRDRGAGGGDDGAGRVRRRGRRPLPELRAHRAAALRRGRHLLGARAALRTWLDRSSASRRTSPRRRSASGSSSRRWSRPTTSARSSARAGGRCSCRRRPRESRRRSTRSTG